MADTISQESICYKRNYLTEVIARVNFAQQVSEISQHLPDEIKKAALLIFPIEEPQKKTSHKFELTKGTVKTEKEDYNEWIFFGKQREKQLTITPDTVFVSYKQYNRYDSLKNEFSGFLSVLFNQFENIQASFLGLRYINTISFPSGDPLDWSKYISQDLLGLFKKNIFGTEPGRIFHNYELVFDANNVRFQFGMHNPDYPAPIRQKVFILDYDANYSGIIENSAITSTLDDYHLQIQSIFEKSITEEMRRIMNE